MLGTILGSLTGFGGSVLPAVMNYFTDKQNSKTKIEELKIQAELMKQGTELDLQKFNARAADD